MLGIVKIHLYENKSLELRLPDQSSNEMIGHPIKSKVSPFKIDSIEKRLISKLSQIQPKKKKTTSKVSPVLTTPTSIERLEKFKGFSRLVK